MKDIATKSTTQYILDKYDLYPKKKYGQNFLIDPHVVEKIVRCSSVNEKCAVSRTWNWCFNSSISTLCRICKKL